MSYDLMVFDIKKAPKTRVEFLLWYSSQVECDEKHDYETVSNTSLSLQNWFMEIKDTFPPMNGALSPNAEKIDNDEMLEQHLTDYCIGYSTIYCSFSWSLTKEAYILVKKLAKKHNVGFFDVSGNESILLPNNARIK